MGQITNIDTLINKERSALYACAKAKCIECPLRDYNEDCMITKLKIFNKIIEELKNGKTLLKQRRTKR